LEGGNVSSAPLHLADLGSDTYGEHISIALLENGGQRLQEINGALERINQGTFGCCKHCGQDIGIERLEAVRTPSGALSALVRGGGARSNLISFRRGPGIPAIAAAKRFNGVALYGERSPSTPSRIDEKDGRSGEKHHGLSSIQSPRYRTTPLTG
jgi:hypothetical protein